MLDPKTKLPTSPDLLSERLQRLRSEFPDLFTAEGGLDRASLESLFSDTPLHREQYRFEWAGKHASKRHAFTPSTARLQYDVSRSVHPDEARGNMIIEGDNLEVLKLLTSAYRGAVKCIYIDPPYNTGKDFVYSDNYTDGREAYWNKTRQVEDGVRVDTNSESAGRYHSDWLSMMHSRLLLARGLLRDDGVIFVSIDDHEVHNLRKLMDEVFGEENFVASVIWERSFSPVNLKHHFSESHDYIICYAKSMDLLHHFSLSRSDNANDRYKNPDNDHRGAWTSSDFSVGPANPKNIYPITTPSGKILLPPNGRSWVFSEDRSKQMIEENRVWFGENGDGVPRLKRFISDVKDGITPMTLWKYKDVGHSQDGAKQLKDIFNGSSFFDYPKPVGLLRQIFEISTTPNDIILDFFAGSGTTGQAVMELNQEDGGNRQYILVQLPELTDEKSEAHKAGYKRISDITIERNKRVIQGYGASPTPLEGVGFRVYTLARSAFPRVDYTPDPEQTDEQNMRALEDYIARKEAVFRLVDDHPGIMDEVVLKNGFRLDATLTRLADITSNTVYLVTDSTGLTACICLDRPISAETVSYFQSHTEHRFICLEQGLDTTAKWNLRNALGELFIAY